MSGREKKIGKFLYLKKEDERDSILPMDKKGLNKYNNAIWSDECIYAATAPHLIFSSMESDSREDLSLLHNNLFDFY